MSKAVNAGTYDLIQWSDGSYRTSVQPAGLWLPSGHWMPAKVPFDPSDQTATQIYPRPDTETNAYAFHRNHYYDGVTQFDQRTPIIARGSSFPYNFVIMDAPAAANARMGASQWVKGWTRDQAVAAGYGDLIVSPTGSYTNARFWVRAYGQDGAYIDFIWTASTVGGYYYNATIPANSYGFIFLDSVNGTDPGSYPSKTGLISTVGSPIKTLSWAFGAAQGTATYPNAILIMRGTGTIPCYAQNSAGISLEGGLVPMAIIGMPGEEVTVDASTAGAGAAWTISSACDDLIFHNFSEINRPPTATDFRHINSQSLHDRFTVYNVSFPNLMVGTNPIDNPGPIYFNDPTSGQWVRRKYIAIKGQTVEITGAVDAFGSNGYGGWDMYKVQYVCAELGKYTGIPGPVCNLKDECSDATVRCNLFVAAANATAGYLVLSYGQNGDGMGSVNQEYCFNIIDNSAVNSNALTFNELQDGNSVFGTVWSYRNSILGQIIGGQPSGNGPYSSEYDAVEYGTGNTQAVIVLVAGSPSNTLPPNVTNNGTARAQAASGVFNDPTNGDYSFASAYAAYAGTDGAIIQ